MKTSRFIGSCLLAAAVLWAPVSHAYSLFLSTDPAAVLPGQSFKVGVNIDDAGDLASFQFSLAFDASRVQLGSPDHSVSGTLLDPAGSALADAFFPFGVLVTPGAGSVDVYADSLGGLLSTAGGGVLLYLNFDVPSTTAAPSSAEFSVTAASLGFNLPDPNSSADPDLSDARTSITIREPGTNIPEPSGLALGALALALAVMPRRRRQRPH